MWWKEDEEPKKREHAQMVRFQKMLTMKVKSWKQIVGNDLEEGVQYRIITDNAFNAISVIRFLVEEFKLMQVYIAVYRMNLQAVRLLQQIIDDNKIECWILLSNFFRENKRYERWSEELITYAENKDQVHLAYSRNHAKVFLGFTQCGKHIVFEGSGNLSDNSRLEQYIYENNRVSFEFHRNWITDEIRKNS